MTSKFPKGLSPDTRHNYYLLKVTLTWAHRCRQRTIDDLDDSQCPNLYRPFTIRSSLIDFLSLLLRTQVCCQLKGVYIWYYPTWLSFQILSHLAKLHNWWEPKEGSQGNQAQPLLSRQPEERYRRHGEIKSMIRGNHDGLGWKLWNVNSLPIEVFENFLEIPRTALISTMQGDKHRKATPLSVELFQDAFHNYFSEYLRDSRTTGSAQIDHPIFLLIMEVRRFLGLQNECQQRFVAGPLNPCGLCSRSCN